MIWKTHYVSPTIFIETLRNYNVYPQTYAEAREAAISHAAEAAESGTEAECLYASGQA
jgi:hypothetical protein